MPNKKYTYLHVFCNYIWAFAWLKIQIWQGATAVKYVKDHNTHKTNGILIVDDQFKKRELFLR